MKYAKKPRKMVAFTYITNDKTRGNAYQTITSHCNVPLEEANGNQRKKTLLTQDNHGTTSWAYGVVVSDGGSNPDCGGKIS